MSEQQAWPGGVAAITLVCEDLAASADFYAGALALEQVYADDDSVAFRLGTTMINLLSAHAAPELVEPGVVAAAGCGVRAVYTLEVGDVDAECARLVERGVALLNGPQDRPWGIRTATVLDPSGHAWELAGPVAAA